MRENLKSGSIGGRWPEDPEHKRGKDEKAMAQRLHDLPGPATSGLPHHGLTGGWGTGPATAPRPRPPTTNAHRLPDAGRPVATPTDCAHSTVVARRLSTHRVMLTTNANPAISAMTANI